MDRWIKSAAVGPSNWLRRVLISKSALLVVLAVILSPNTGFAHGGRTDSNGGHNCNVGACRGTYHYHNDGSSSGGAAYTITIPSYTYTPRVTVPPYAYTPRVTVPPYDYNPSLRDCDFRLQDECLRDFLSGSATSTAPATGFSPQLEVTLPRRYQIEADKQVSGPTWALNPSVESGFLEVSPPFKEKTKIRTSELIYTLVAISGIVLFLRKCKQIGERR